MTLPVFAQVKRRLADKIPAAADLQTWLQSELYPMLRQLREDFNAVVGNASLGTGFNGGAFPFGGVTFRITVGVPTILSDPVGSFAFDIAPPSTYQFYRLENPGPAWVRYPAAVAATNPILTLTGLAFYVDRLIALPTITGTNVTAWADLSSAGNSLNDVSATNPQWFDGLGVKFTTANTTYLRRTATNLMGAGPGASAYSLGMVFRYDTISGADEAFFGNTDAAVGGIQFAYSNGGVCWQIQAPGVANQQDGALPVGKFFACTIRRAAADFDDFRINDAPRALAGATNAQLAPGAAGELIIGGRGSGGGVTQHANCTIAAAFFCSADIGVSAMSSVISYWRSQYFLQT